jgi:hypothetical protein
VLNGVGTSCSLSLHESLSSSWSSSSCHHGLVLIVKCSGQWLMCLQNCLFEPPQFSGSHNFTGKGMDEVRVVTVCLPRWPFSHPLPRLRMHAVIPPFLPRRHGAVFNWGGQIHLYLLEVHSSSGNVSDLQLSGGRFETRPGHSILTEVIVIFRSPSRDMP